MKKIQILFLLFSLTHFLVTDAYLFSWLKNLRTQQPKKVTAEVLQEVSTKLKIKKWRELYFELNNLKKIHAGVLSYFNNKIDLSSDQSYQATKTILDNKFKEIHHKYSMVYSKTAQWEDHSFLAALDTIDDFINHNFKVELSIQFQLDYSELDLEKWVNTKL